MISGGLFPPALPFSGLALCFPGAELLSASLSDSVSLPPPLLTYGTGFTTDGMTTTDWGTVVVCLLCNDELPVRRALHTPTPMHTATTTAHTSDASAIAARRGDRPPGSFTAASRRRSAPHRLAGRLREPLSCCSVTAFSFMLLIRRVCALPSAARLRNTRLTGYPGRPALTAWVYVNNLFFSVYTGNE